MSMDIGHHGNNKGKEEHFDLSQLPSSKGWRKSSTIFQYQGTWYPSEIIPTAIAFQKTFQAQDQDIFLASSPKSGTTWLKALLFSVINRGRYTPSNTPLLASNPHKLVPLCELNLFSDINPTSPRLLSTHTHYPSLPESIVRNPSCRIVYICRNPLVFIASLWHFGAKSLTVGECVDKFCRGEHEFRPFWAHVLGFWKASLERQREVLFLKYEDVLEDAVSHVERIGEFVGFPFTDEEKNQGVVEQIVELCSFESLKELDVNKHGSGVFDLENKSFFRKGKVGDWVNHLSSSMVERVEKVIHEKLSGSGLTFKYM